MNLTNVHRNPAPRVERSARPELSDLDLTGAVRSDACVLLTGITHAVRAVARRIHSLSGWRHGSFTIVDCRWPEEFVEHLLYEIFADGEVSSPAPRARLAQSGTVLLQDVGRLTPSMQAWLADRLMSLRDRRRPGSPRCRLMASTSEPLLPRVLDGTFDDRLFYRLNVIHLVISGEAVAAAGRRMPDADERRLIGHAPLQGSSIRQPAVAPRSPGAGLSA